ncbi:MAG: T9SS type A sorting domain-containing protein [Bacteroidia bacterium]|nr:T9SS type A sorting domain-containing protein [Bacteroidia bacterium]
MKRNYTLVLLLWSFFSANAQYVDTSMWVPDYPVNCFAEFGTEIFLGGGFTNFARHEPNGSTTDTVAGLPHNITNPNGFVWATVADGSGGWFIGGEFTKVGTSTHNRLAHVDSVGNPYPWSPDVNGTVFTFIISGDTLYFGGQFTMVNGQPRNNAAAVLISTGALTTWNPNLNNAVKGIIVHGGDSVFIGGQFTTANSSTRNYIALVDNINGTLYPWSVSLNNTVFSFVIYGNRLYIGGAFTTINTTTTRKRGACYNLSGMSLMSWHPNADNTILVMKEYNNRFFIGGNFFQLNNVNHQALAEVDPLTGAVVSPLVASQTITIYGIIVTGNRIYISGLFAMVNGFPRENAADLNINTGALGNWQPAPGREVYSMAVSGNRIYLGGAFQGTGSIPRRNLAAIDKQTGQLTAFNPYPTGEVNTMLVKDSVLYLGGLFASIGNSNRLRLASIYLPTDTVTPWNPSANGEVVSMIYDDSVIYICGDFTIVDGQGRNKVAAITYGTDSVSAWNPPVIVNSSSKIYAIAKIDSLLYVGGTFNYVSTDPRSKLAAYHVGHNDSVAPWNPGANGTVWSMSSVGNRLLIRGTFTTIAGQPFNGLAMVDTAGSVSSLFAPDYNGNVTSYFVSGADVFTSGNFATCNGDPRNKFAVVDLYDAHNTSKQLTTDVSFSRLYVSGDWLYCTGTGYGTVNGFPYQRLTRVVAPGEFRITGKVWYDTNGNGLNDNGENPAPYYPVEISSLSYTTYTDLNGVYSFYVDSGAYSVNPVQDYYVISSIPSSHAGAVNANSPVDSLNDFGLIQAPNINDLEVVITSYSVARSNTPRHYNIEYINHGSNLQNATLTLQDDFVHAFTSSNPAEDFIVADTVYYTQTALSPGQRTNVTASYVLGIHPVGTPVECSAHVSPTLNDTTPDNNHDTLGVLLMASLDPNFKEVFPSEVYQPLSISEFEYVVHFQNTGNDTAIHVVLKDSLSPFLNPADFTMLAASHPCRFSIQNSVLTVSFDSIMLVDSTTNEMLSHGFFHYRIGVDSGLQANTIITNTAYIFFDFNEPVITNTTVSILLTSVITEAEEVNETPGFEIYPVPNEGVFTVVLDTIPDNQIFLSIYSVTGQLMKQQELSQSKSEVDARSLADGVYVLRVTDKNGHCTMQRKFAVLRNR